MAEEWDERKRVDNRTKHGVDFSDFVDFEMPTAVHRLDRRRDYGEERTISTGYIRGRLHVLCWTWRDGRVRIISLRKANDREKKAYARDAGSPSTPD